MNGCQPQGTLHVQHVMQNENFFWKEPLSPVIFLSVFLFHCFFQTICIPVKINNYEIIIKS